MKTYHFRTAIVGGGENMQEAWEDACEGFSIRPGDIPCDAELIEDDADIGNEAKLNGDNSMETYEVVYVCTRTIQVQANTRREASSKARNEFYGDFDLSPDDFTSKVGVPLVDHTHLDQFLDN